MNLWILRFIPHAGAAPVDGHFKTEERALEVEALADAEENGKHIRFKDDFGIKVRLFPKHYAVVLTNCESSAKFTAALQTANRHFQQIYGVPPDGRIAPGSSIQ